MIKDIFIWILNLSVLSAIFIICAILIRSIFKYPKWVRYILWAVVAFRLVCPVFIISDVDISPINIFLNDSDVEQSITAKYSTYYDNSTEQDSSGANIDFNAQTEKLNVNYVENRTFEYVSYIWLFGVVALIGYLIMENRRTRNRVRTAVRFDKIKNDLNIEDRGFSRFFFSDDIRSPFTMGVFKPCVFLSTETKQEDSKYIIAHELTHVRRKDYMWKQIGFVILALHWFNPLVWVAYYLFCKDIELACDEKVVSVFGEREIKNYFTALLNSADKKSRLTIENVTFNGSFMRKRLAEIKNYKKVSLKPIIAAIFLIVLVGTLFFIRPKRIIGQDNYTLVNKDAKTELERFINQFTYGYLIDSFDQDEYRDQVLSYIVRMVISNEKDDRIIYDDESRYIRIPKNLLDAYIAKYKDKYFAVPDIDRYASGFMIEAGNDVMILHNHLRQLGNKVCIDEIEYSNGEYFIKGHGIGVEEIKKNRQDYAEGLIDRSELIISGKLVFEYEAVVVKKGGGYKIKSIKY